MPEPRRALVVMAKAPLPGFAKTRLQRELGLADDEIARIAEAFLRDTLAACREASAAEIRVHFAPDDAAEVLRRIAPDVALVPQVDGDLGARMHAAIRAAFDAGSARVVVLGTDTPHVAAATLRSAFDALERAECVLGPAEDGGYWSIGLRSPRLLLFEGVEWSTPRVLQQTLQRALESGTSCIQLAPDYDVDGARDLARLARGIERGELRCDATARALAALGRDLFSAPLQ
jgi:rSAM/selenodomain-associated transferase 1